jgi:predicted XRE-type DNA-binding protein
MSDDDIETVLGSGNVFRDFGQPNADVEQLKAVLAAKIIGVLDARKMSVRRAHEVTGFAAADFSRVRQAKLARFTVDRLMSMLDRLGQQVDISVDIRPRRRRATHQTVGASRLTRPGGKREGRAPSRKLVAP